MTRNQCQPKAAIVSSESIDVERQILAVQQKHSDPPAGSLIGGTLVACGVLTAVGAIAPAVGVFGAAGWYWFHKHSKSRKVADALEQGIWLPFASEGVLMPFLAKEDGRKILRDQFSRWIAQGNRLEGAARGVAEHLDINPDAPTLRQLKRGRVFLEDYESESEAGANHTPLLLPPSPSTPFGLGDYPASSANFANEQPFDSAAPFALEEPLRDGFAPFGDGFESDGIDEPVVTPEPPAKELTAPEIVQLPLSDRANYLLDLLARQGCDLRRLVRRPTLAAGGLQRSGKSTLILLLAILEKAMGQELIYITRDTDLYPIAFDGFTSGSSGKAVEALKSLNQLINTSAMGALKGRTYVVDEFLRTILEACAKDSETVDSLWNMLLTGFAKQGARVRIITHAKTATSNKVPGGLAETFKSEIKLIWAERKEVEDGYLPSGCYEAQEEHKGHYQPTGETFRIPDWLLMDKNPGWHDSPCPVRTMLRFFPEFDTRKGAIAHPLNIGGKQNHNPLTPNPQSLTEEPSLSFEDFFTGLDLPEPDESQIEQMFADLLIENSNDPTIALNIPSDELEQRRLRKQQPATDDAFRAEIERAIAHSGADGITARGLGSNSWNSGKRADANRILNALCAGSSSLFEREDTGNGTRYWLKGMRGGSTAMFYPANLE